MYQIQKVEGYKKLSNVSDKNELRFPNFTPLYIHSQKLQIKTMKYRVRKCQRYHSIPQLLTEQESEGYEAILMSDSHGMYTIVFKRTRTPYKPTK